MHRRSSWNQSRTLSAAAFGLLLPLVAGCGSNGASSPMAPVAPVNQVGTLVVVASISSDADPSGNFVTQFTVTAADTGTGAPATGATVSFDTPSGSVSLVEDSGTPGTYRAQTNSHAAGSFDLTVTRGSDVATGSVSMPDSHAITSPAMNDTVSSNGALNVTWSRAAAAEGAGIDTKNWPRESQIDRGSGKVPKGHNQINADQLVGVTRRNTATPANMAPGSVLRASVRVTVEPVVVN